MVSDLPKVNIRPSDVLVALATLLAVELQVAIVTEWLLVLQCKLLANQLAVTSRTGKTFAVICLILKLHSIIFSDVLVTDTTAWCIFSEEAIVAVYLFLAAHKLHAPQRPLAFEALEAVGVPDIILVGDDALMTYDLFTTHSAIEFSISSWLRFI